MGERTKIGWCDATWTPIIGCSKVSNGCKFCYAERDLDHRHKKAKWGPNGTPVLTGEEKLEKATALAPLRTSELHTNYFAAVEDSWVLHSSSGQGVFRFMGSVQERTLGIWVVPNAINNRTYSISGTFAATGGEVAAWTMNGVYSRRVTND